MIPSHLPSYDFGLLRGSGIWMEEKQCKKCLLDWTVERKHRPSLGLACVWAHLSREIPRVLQLCSVLSVASPVGDGMSSHSSPRWAPVLAWSHLALCLSSPLSPSSKIEDSSLTQSPCGPQDTTARPLILEIPRVQVGPNSATFSSPRARSRLTSCLGCKLDTCSLMTPLCVVFSNPCLVFGCGKSGMGY